ncbi:hypothetical protein [uncultured Desulfobacter sp.]|uniref:hypothetical protein n=1 Tax=uncultured Desulfobacter sp. TaxID=240139 RepID=UPI0029F52789|nr:hypothetical protein [uncultured Desulfobacter sp.]
MDEIVEDVFGNSEEDIYTFEVIDGSDGFPGDLTQETDPLDDSSLFDVSEDLSTGLEVDNPDASFDWTNDRPENWSSFDPAAVDPDALTGDPAADMDRWHEQVHPDSCAIVSQEFVLESVLDRDFSEQELVDIAVDHGWYTPGSGTTLPDMGRLMEFCDLEVSYEENCTLDDLINKLENREKVIVAVDSDEIWNPGLGEDEFLADFHGIPGQGVNHAVQVIGIDQSDPDNPFVIINDPGTSDGKGLSIPADDFNEAWEDSNHYLVSTSGENVQTVGGYYDKEGTYLWCTESYEPGYGWMVGGYYNKEGLWIWDDQTYEHYFTWEKGYY